MGQFFSSKKHFFIIRSISIIFMLLTTPAVNATSKKAVRIIHFKAAHGPYQVILKPLTVFKEEVEKLTNGRIKVELIIPQNRKEASESAVTKTFNDVSSGKVEMSQLYSAYMAVYEKDFLALEIPFILKDHQHAFEVVDGEIGKNLLASLEAKSPLKGLGFTYCGGYRIIGSEKTKITQLENFKDLKIAADSLMSNSALEELGATIIPKVSKEDVIPFFTAKKINGYVTVYPRYFYGNEYKTARIANELNFNTQFTVLVINKEFFKTLSDKDKKIVEFAAQKASTKERQLAIDIARDVSEKANEYGIEVVKMSAEEKQKMVEKLDQVNWSKKHNISSEIIEKIKNLPKKNLTSL